MLTTDPNASIYRDPNVRGGRPCIVGTSLRISDIVMQYKYGIRHPERIAARFQITLAQVNAALAYYRENKSEIDNDIEENLLFDEKLEDLGIYAAVDWLLLRRANAGHNFDAAVEPEHIFRDDPASSQR